MWVKLDDTFTDHPKVMEVGPLCGWLYVCGLTYCARYLTDGFIRDSQVKKLADVKNATNLAKRLVSVGLWDKVNGGYRIHDYSDYNPPAETVKNKRKNEAKRLANFRQKQTENETL